jgi:hypothetical protein
MLYSHSCVCQRILVAEIITRKEQRKQRNTETPFNINKDLEMNNEAGMKTDPLPLKVSMHRILEGKKFALTPYTKGDNIYVLCEDTGTYMEHTVGEILDSEDIPMKEVLVSELPSHECDELPGETLFIGTKYHTIRRIFTNEETGEEVMELTDLESGDEICFACPPAARRFYFKSQFVPGDSKSQFVSNLSDTTPVTTSKVFVFVVFERDGRIFIEEGMRGRDYTNGIRASYEGIDGKIQGFVALTNGAVMHVRNDDGDYLVVAYPTRV